MTDFGSHTWPTEAIKLQEPTNELVSQYFMKFHEGINKIAQKLIWYISVRRVSGSGAWPGHIHDSQNYELKEPKNEGFL